jgi:hypothetical protein
VALQSLKDLGRLTYRRFLELFRHMVWLLGRVISPSQGLYLHRTTQHRKTRTDIHALSRIRTHDPSNQLAKTHASDRTATVTGVTDCSKTKIYWVGEDLQLDEFLQYGRWNPPIRFTVYRKVTRRPSSKVVFSLEGNLTWTSNRVNSWVLLLISHLWAML